MRDFFHYCDNHIDALDRAAERFGLAIAGADQETALAQWLADHLATDLHLIPGGALRRYNPAAKMLTLSAEADPTTRAFHICHQIALLAHMDLLEATLDLARFRTDEARDIARIGPALLHKSAEGRASAFPGHTYPTGCVMGMPRAV